MLRIPCLHHSIQKRALCLKCFVFFVFVFFCVFFFFFFFLVLFCFCFVNLIRNKMDKMDKKIPFPAMAVIVYLRNRDFEFTWVACLVFLNPGHTLLPIFPSFRPMGMVGEACLPSNAYYPRTPDYTLCSGVHVCWSEHSDSSFVYGFMILDYGFGTMTATTFICSFWWMNVIRRITSKTFWFWPLYPWYL